METRYLHIVHGNPWHTLSINGLECTGTEDNKFILMQQFKHKTNRRHYYDKWIFFIISVRRLYFEKYCGRK